MAYFLKEKVIIDWQFLFVIGVLFAPWHRPGSRRNSGRSPCRRCGKAASGVAPPPLGCGLSGGVILMFGARLADG